MKELKENEVMKIVGGISISGPLINAVSTIMKTIYSIGQGVGGALRRITTGKVCKI